jgi:hypothetical protein
MTKNLARGSRNITGRFSNLEEEQQAVEIVDGTPYGGAGDAPPIDPGEPEGHLGRPGEGGLDHLRLVKADPPPLDTGQRRRHSHESEQVELDKKSLKMFTHGFQLERYRYRYPGSG